MIGVADCKYELASRKGADNRCLVISKNVNSYSDSATPDDTVLDKRASESIELVRRQNSGTEHRVLRGIGLINCVYINPEKSLFWVISTSFIGDQRAINLVRSVDMAVLIVLPLLPRF